jgi:hypothetical protein
MDMKREFLRHNACLLIAGAVSAFPAAAGTIFGTIVQGGAPVVSAQLTLVCPGGSTNAATDNTGSYRFTVAPATCTLTYQGGGVTAASQVIVYDDPARYDFRVEGGQLVRQ